MPDRAMRPNPGSGYNNAGGKLDLGKILLGIFGGVSANPDYNQEIARPDSNFNGPMPAKPGSQDFFKARSIFNNADAAEMNAAFREQQLLNNQEEERKNRLLDATVPREVRLRNAIDPLDINKRQAENTLDVNKQALLGTQSNFSRAGLLNLADIPQSSEMTQKNNLEDVAAQQNAARINAATGVNNAKLGYDIEQQSQPFSIRQALANAQGGAIKSEGEVTNLPTEIKSQGIIARETPLWKAMQAREQSIKAGQPGETFLDTITGKPLYNVPLQPIQQLINQSITGKLNTSPQGQNPQPNSPTAIPPRVGNTGQVEEMDPSKLVRIGGKLYIRH